jgi:Ca-activated chloride channel family protein
MRKAAQFGRGTFTYVGSPSEVSTRMDELFRKLERPALADIAIDWQGADDETWPDRLPDLYAGEPLVVAVALRELPETVTVSGRLGAAPWKIVIHQPALESQENGTGIPQLWARRKIEALMDSAVAGADRETVRRDVIAVALEHHLVSNYTSLVAVDVTPTAPGDAQLLTHDFPVGAPNGSALTLPRTATAARLYWVLALLSMAAAALLRPLGNAVTGQARQ